MAMKKNEHSRAFLYRIYKAICKKLGAEMIGYGKVSKFSKDEILYALAHGEKWPLMMSNNNKIVTLALRKNCQKADLQKAIVKRIMQALEKSDVWIECHMYGSKAYWNPDDSHCIKQSTCFEQVLVEMDLNG